MNIDIVCIDTKYTCKGMSVKEVNKRYIVAENYLGSVRMINRKNGRVTSEGGRMGHVSTETLNTWNKALTA